MENEMMYNEEVVETVEEIAETGCSNNGFKKVAIAGLVVAGAVVVYQITKKVIKNIKAKKALENEIEETFEATEDVEDVCEEDSEN